MFLKQTKRGGRTYLSVVQNYREGSRVRTKTVESLGYVDELAAQWPDPTEHFRAYVAQLNQQQEAEAAPVRLTIARNARIAPEGADAVSLGAALCVAHLDALDAGQFFDGEGAGRIFELLAAARMMHAVPMHQTWTNRTKFPRHCPDDFGQIYAALPALAAKRDAYIAHLTRRYEALRGRPGLDNVRLVFSNYTFAWPAQGGVGGPDEVGDAGQSWARLCVAIDSRGIPLTYKLVPRDLGPEELRQLVDDLRAETEARRVTLVAAQLTDHQAVMRQMVESGNGFVLLVPAAKASPQLKEWMGQRSGYRLANNGTHRLKSRIAEGALERRGQRLPLKEIAFKSASGGNDEAFAVVSSEVQLSDASIFNIYRELWRVHEPFQVISADFIGMPHAVDSRTHLEAHFLICYTAFFALRLLRQAMNWRYNATTVADALVRMEGAYLDENWFLFNYRTAVTDAIQAACGVDQGRRIMSRDDIRRCIAAAKRHLRHSILQ